MSILGGSSSMPLWIRFYRRFRSEGVDGVGIQVETLKPIEDQGELKVARSQDNAISFLYSSCSYPSQLNK
jgi:hypothetical protein